MKNNSIKSALLGLAIGDALGVPVEFKSREYLKLKPITDMIGMGTHEQIAGTWSDDSSLTFCLAESLLKGYDLKDIANNFLKWHNSSFWTAHGSVFDIGITTNDAIKNIKKGFPPTLCGGLEEDENGNGSLMRILPIAFYLKDFSIQKRYDIVKDLSSITHAHIRSKIACFIYIEFVLQIMSGLEKYSAYEKMKSIVNEFINTEPICSQYEQNIYDRILVQDISKMNEDSISSSGYVVSSLEASLWCFLNTNSYKEAVLKAVNLGNDTDTVAAITGGLAGLYYGVETVPQNWIDCLARKNDIISLCNNLENKLNK